MLYIFDINKEHDMGISRDVDYTGLPDKFQREAREYIEFGVRPGPFIEAVLESHLRDALDMAALEAADQPAALELINIVDGWLCGQAPVKCYGSVGAVYKWIEAKGLTGLEQKVKDDVAFANEYKTSQRELAKNLGGAQNIPAYRKFLSVISRGRV